jgi:hypothetical protein
MTEQGADTVLLWNPEFFHEFCPLVLGQPAWAFCDLGFGNYTGAPSAKPPARGAGAPVNASCAELVSPAST